MNDGEQLHIRIKLHLLSHSLPPVSSLAPTLGLEELLLRCSDPWVKDSKQRFHLMLDAGETRFGIQVQQSKDLLNSLCFFH